MRADFLLILEASGAHFRVLWRSETKKTPFFWVFIFRLFFASVFFASWAAPGRFLADFGSPWGPILGLKIQEAHAAHQI